MGGRIGKIELGVPQMVNTERTEMSCNGSSRKVRGAVDARFEVVEGRGKEIESGWEVWPQMVNTECKRSLAPWKKELVLLAWYWVM